MRGKALFVAAAGILLASGQAHADLLGTTLDTMFFAPDTTSASAHDLGTVTVGSSLEYDGNPADTATYNSAAGQLGVSIDITGTQITITNLFSGVPFCSTAAALPCPASDIFVGFKFIFSNFAAGVHITGVSTNGATPADFQPADPPTSDPSDVLVNLVGDEPVPGDQLVLDLTLSSPNGGGGGGAVPEPASLLMLASGLLALSGFTAWRRQVARR